MKFFSLKILSLIAFTLFLALLRILPHPWNFTPLLAGALYLGTKFNWWKSSLLVVSSMVLSDSILGFHSMSLEIYMILAVISLGGQFLKSFNFKKTLGISFASSLVFFFLSNLLVWNSSGMYSHDLGGLIQCYSMAIPFFHNTLISTTLYLYAFFGLEFLLLTKTTLPHHFNLYFGSSKRI